MAGRTIQSPLRESLRAFVAERHPFGLPAVLGAFDALNATDLSRARAHLRKVLPDAIRTHLTSLAFPGVETTPGVTSETRAVQAATELIDAVDGFFARSSIAHSLTDEERVEMWRGMVLTRAVDNRLKQFFSGGEVRYGAASFQGKGFRSLGQEAIYAAPIRFKRGTAWRTEEGQWRGDVVAPLIRDLGAALAMRGDGDAVRAVLSAQMGKAGPPMEGRDLHVGDFSWGVLPASAPLSISTLTAAGMGFAFAHTKSDRVAVSFIGEGGSSLGEWHEAINLCGARRLPVIFCLQNNQTALSTPVADQSAVRVFADKASGYGMPGITIDGTDPEAVMAAFTWAADRARAGQGPTLIELVAMRMCGHAHHDDMLYLGKDPQPGWDYAPLAEGAVLGACIGAALAGLRPIGEIQFNDFVATGFNQLVNSAAKIRYRWGGDVPMVVRMPWGGLRHAGPYHSQNTEPWFYRTPGLKIVTPSTPHDARALMAAAVADPDPVLFYEHIALYRDPRVKQLLDPAAPAPLPIGKAALRRAGNDLVIISYGAFVHVGLRVAERLAADGIQASVLDLRTIAPLDRAAVLAVARQTGRVLIIQEDSRTGGIGESLAAIIQEEAFEWLDAPVRIVGALDTPVPYSPPLEDAFLPSEADVERAARCLMAY